MLREPINRNITFAVGQELPEQDNQHLWRSSKTRKGTVDEARSPTLWGGVVDLPPSIYNDD